MRTVIQDCSNRSDHPLHVSDPRFSMYSCVEDLERIICPGGRVGDKRLRNEDAADIIRQWDEEHGQTLLVALAESTGRPIDRSRVYTSTNAYDRDDDEPDYEAIAEARAEARAEQDLERAEAAYERYVYGD